MSAADSLHVCYSLLLISRADMHSIFTPRCGSSDSDGSPSLRLPHSFHAYLLPHNGHPRIPNTSTSPDLTGLPGTIGDDTPFFVLYETTHMSVCVRCLCKSG